MNAQEMPQPGPQGTEPKKFFGCGALGCLGGCAGCGGAVLIALIVFGYWVQSTFMPTEPLTPSERTVSDAQVTAMEDKIKSFKETFEAGEPVELTLKQTEADALMHILSREEDIEVLETDIEGDSIGVRLSRELPDQPGHYFNVIFKGHLDFGPSHFSMRPDKLQVGSFDITPYLDADNPEFAQGMENALRDNLRQVRAQHGVDIEQISVRDGQLYIKVQKVK
jgi:hypothetical protein